MATRRDRRRPRELSVDLAGALENVGDRTRAAGSADLEFNDTYEAEFVGGDLLSWTLQLLRITGGVQVTGDVAGALRLSCYRCLEEFMLPLAVKVDEVALWVAPEEREEGDQEDEYMVTGDVLDLEPILRDAVYLAIPVKRICSEGCKGICPACGENRNLVDCGCPDRPPDARLKPLQELKRRLEND